MTDYLDLIEEDEPMYGGVGLRVDLDEGARMDIQPSCERDGRVFVLLCDPLGKEVDAHISNPQAMALGLALIRCATEKRDDSA